MTLPPLTQADAQAKLADHMLMIGECLRAGADRYNESRAAFGVLSARSQASIIHDYAAEHAEILFAGDDRVTPRRIAGDLMVLDVDGEFLIRFHKLADGWEYSRNDTRQSRRWERQLPLDGMPLAHYLSAAYRLDAHGREMDLVALVYRSNGRYQWHIEIPTLGEVLELPTTFDELFEGPDIQSDDDIVSDEDVDENADEHGS